MKRLFCIALIFILLLTTCACGSETKTDKNNIATQAGGSEYDVDLTKLSSVMLYSEVNNMVTNPKDYIDKKIKMCGQFAVYDATDENGNPIPDVHYYACVIEDATACCAKGLEFVLKDEHIYPDDYPKEGEEITVSGYYETYEEYGYTYCRIRDAEIL